MGFSEGTEDEFLLTCFVCKEPFGMLAAFCGGCGARRDQAMGIERARSSQQITQNQIETPSLLETFPVKSESQSSQSQTTQTPSGNDLLAGFGRPQTNQETSSTPKEARPPKQRKKSIRRQIFVSNMRLRIDLINQWQSRHARLLNALGGVLFIGVTYVFIQSYIVGTSHPEIAAEEVIKAGVSRDAAYFDINNDIKGAESHPIFPIKYSKGVEATEWLHFSDIHGLTGTAEVSVVPAGSEFDQTPIVLKMKATYVKTMGIFRKPIWVPAEQTATVKITYPNRSNTLIYINGYAAGTTDNPAVKEGTYFIYPGRLEVKFYRNGNETSDSYSYFIQPSGSY